MKKSVKKILAICSLVIFCSVFVSNILFVPTASAASAMTINIPKGYTGADRDETVDIKFNKDQLDAELKTRYPGQTIDDKLRKEFVTSVEKARQLNGKTVEEYYKGSAFVLGISHVDKNAKNSGTGTGVQTQSGAEADAKSSGASSVNGTGNYTAPVGGAYCQNTKNVFETLACKITTTLDDLRMVIYVLAGFGLVAFAFSAIFGKISWKHLGQIGFGLFLVSMMAPFITYFTHPEGEGYKITYGDYLPAGDFSKDYALVGGTATMNPEDCKKLGESGIDKGSYCLDEVAVVGKAKEKAPTGSWSLKDLKGTVQSAIKTAQAVHSTVQATTSAVKEVKAQAQLVSGALKNSGGGIDGLLNIAGTVANAGSSLGQVGYTLGNNIQHNVATAANSYQDSFLTNEQRAYNEKQRAAGEQTNKLATVVSDKRSGITKKGENFYDASGNKILVKANEEGKFVNAATGEVIGDKIDASGNVVTASQFTNVVTQVEKGREYAMKGGAGLTSASNDSQNMNNMVGGIGGGFLGNVAGLVTLGASATGNLVDADSQIKNNTQAKKEAQGSQAASVSGVKTNVSDKNGNKTITYNDGTVETKNKDGSTSIKYANGTTISKSASGIVTETKANGSSVTKNKDGSTTNEYAGGGSVTVAKDGKVLGYKDAAGNTVSNPLEAQGYTSETKVEDKRTAEQKAIMGETSSSSSGSSKLSAQEEAAIDAELKVKGDAALAKMENQQKVLDEIKKQNGGQIVLTAENIKKMKDAGFDMSKYGL